MVEGGDDSREIIADGEGVRFVVGAVRVSETCGTHGEATGVPGVGDFEGVGGEGSEDIGGGVGGDIFLEACGEGFVRNVLDGEGERGGVGDRVGRRKTV
jgi:hypothetical protein